MASCDICRTEIVDHAPQAIRHRWCRGKRKRNYGNKRTASCQNPTCGKQYQTTSGQTKFCSHACRIIARPEQLPHDIYLASSPDGRFQKIGISRDPWRRINDVVLPFALALQVYLPAGPNLATAR